MTTSSSLELEEEEEDDMVEETDEQKMFERKYGERLRAQILAQTQRSGVSSSPYSTFPVEKSNRILRIDTDEA